jgi:hypothetical protein
MQPYSRDPVMGFPSGSQKTQSLAQSFTIPTGKDAIKKQKRKSYNKGQPAKKLIKSVKQRYMIPDLKIEFYRLKKNHVI